MLEIIFNHQRELMNKYHSIEEKNVGHNIPFSADENGPYCGRLNIQDRASQLRLKDFAWRVTEELTEATLCLIPDASDKIDKTHYEEELIDALHFSVELCALSGLRESSIAGELKSTDVKKDMLEWLFYISQVSSVSHDFLSRYDAHSLLRNRAYVVIENLGEAMNFLKLKPWKTTAMLTDERAYIQCIRNFFISLIELLKTSGFNAKSATHMYLRKNSVNKFRQNSAY